MAEDFTTVIKDEFEGSSVDAIGESYGGLIAFPLAASHPRFIRRLVIAMFAYRFSTEDAQLICILPNWHTMVRQGLCSVA